MSTSSLDIVVGGSWKVDARHLARLYSYRGDDERFDFTPILDIIDIVVDGANITSRLPEESVFCVMHELVAGLSSMIEQRLDKHIVSFSEAGWELAIQRASDELEISFYGVDRPRHVSVHNVKVVGNQLLDTVCAATERLLSDLVIVNDAFSREATVQSLAIQLKRLRAQRLRAHGFRQELQSEPPPPQAPERVAYTVGDRRLGMAVTLDATYTDLWRYQGAQVSDLHSLLFTGTLHLTYWGRKRVLGDGSYLFPLVEGLVSGAGRVLGLFERRVGACVVLDGSDGSESLLTAELTDADHLVLRVTEPNGGVGKTRTTPEQVFAIIVDTAQQLLDAVIELNPKQVLNHRIDDLRGEVERLRRQFHDVRRGDVYFDGVQGYLRSVPSVEPVERNGADRDGSMPYPIDKLRHVFLHSSWYLARHDIHYREVTAAGEGLLVPSDGRLDCISRDRGKLHWSAAADGLLGVTSDLALVRVADGFQGLDIETGAVQLTVALGRPVSSITLFRLDGAPAAIAQLSEAEIAAVDIGSGATLWRFQLEHGEIVGLCLAGPVVALVSDDGFAYGVRPAEGSVLWKVRVPGTCVLTPAVHQGRLYLCAETVVGLEGILYAIYPLTGRRVYERRAPTSISRPPLFIGGIGVFALETPGQATIIAIDLEDGTRLWSHHIETAHIDPPVLTWVDHDTEGTLLIKTDTGHCRGVRLTDGALKWTTNLLDPGDILLSNLEPALLDRHVVIAERYTSVLDPSTGNRLHRFTNLPEHPAYLHVDDNLRLIMGEGDDHLECFDLSGFLALVGE